MASEWSFILCLKLIIRVIRDPIELTLVFIKPGIHKALILLLRTCLEEVWVVFFEIPSNQVIAKKI